MICRLFEWLMCIRSFLLRRLGCCVTRVPLMPSRADVKKTQRHDKKRKLTTKPKRFQIYMSTCRLKMLLL